MLYLTSTNLFADFSHKTVPTKFKLKHMHRQLIEVLKLSINKKHTHNAHRIHALVSNYVLLPYYYRLLIIDLTISSVKMC